MNVSHESASTCSRWHGDRAGPPLSPRGDGGAGQSNFIRRRRTRQLKRVRRESGHSAYLFFPLNRLNQRDRDNLISSEENQVIFSELLTSSKCDTYCTCIL